MNLILENINIDWAELREQKLILINTIDDKEHSECEITKAEGKELNGILHLLDYIQDQGVESGMWTEEEIFDI